jgi:hypothetical protein
MLVGWQYSETIKFLPSLNWSSLFIIIWGCWSCRWRFCIQDNPSSRPVWIDWLIDYLLFYVPLKNISLIWRRHHYRWRAAKFRPMLGAQGLWAGRDLYRATPAVTRGLGFSGLIRRNAPFSRLLRHTRGCGGSILPRILTGQYGYDSLKHVTVINCNRKQGHHNDRRICEMMISNEIH